MNTPKIRFPGFKNSWNNSILGEIVSHKNDFYKPNKKESLKCIELENLNKNTGTINGYFDSNTQKSIKNVFVEGDILYGKLRPYLKKYWYANFNGICSSEIWVIRSISKKLNSKFLYNFIQTDSFTKNINLTSGTKMPRANWNIVKELILHYPSQPEEQQKIGDFFMLLDKRIEQQEQKIALLKDYKKAMMQKIFSQKIRFKDGNGNDYPDWEEKKLGEIGIFYRGHSYKATDVSSEGLLVLRSNNISNDSITLNTGLQYVTKKCNNEIILENNDIVICMANGSKNLVGKSGIFHKKNEFQTVTAGAFCSIYRTQNSLSRYLFQTDKYKKYLSILFSGTNINNLKNSDLEELKFKLPKRAEEKRIFLLFQKLDINIEKQEGILENLKNQKEVLLQKMFI